MITTKLAIIVLGKRNSGKSSTWYEIFYARLRSGYKKFRIANKEISVYVKNSSFEEMGMDINKECFVKNTSFEETAKDASSYLTNKRIPDLVFCAVQYTDHGKETIKFFIEQGYYIYIQWLNPGFKDNDKYDDSLAFEALLNSGLGELHKVTGKEVIERSKTIKTFVMNWIETNNIL